MCLVSEWIRCRVLTVVLMRLAEMTMVMLDRDDDDDDVYNNYACNHFNFDVNDLYIE